jgi:hypothetical protein
MLIPDCACIPKDGNDGSVNICIAPAFNRILIQAPWTQMCQYIQFHFQPVSSVQLLLSESWTGDEDPSTMLLCMSVSHSIHRTIIEACLL